MSFCIVNSLKIVYVKYRNGQRCCRSICFYHLRLEVFNQRSVIADLGKTICFGHFGKNSIFLFEFQLSFFLFRNIKHNTRKEDRFPVFVELRDSPSVIKPFVAAIYGLYAVFDFIYIRSSIQMIKHGTHRSFIVVGMQFLCEELIINMLWNLAYTITKCR